LLRRIPPTPGGPVRLSTRNQLAGTVTAIDPGTEVVLAVED
jgi:hypothetical protein